MFQVSPGVNISEIDLSTVIPAVATTSAGIVGAFAWGPAEQITLVNDELSLVSQFGKPFSPVSDQANDSIYFLTAASFLSYGRGLKVVRMVGSAALNAGAKEASASSGYLVKNDDAYDTVYGTAGLQAAGEWIARFPGALGNSLKVSVCPSATAFSNASPSGTIVTSTASKTVTGTNTAFDTQCEEGDLLYTAGDVYIGQVATIGSATSITLVDNAEVTVNPTAAFKRKWEYADYVGKAPGTSDWVSARSGANDEMHVIVVDEDGLFTGAPGQVVERWLYVSKASDARNDDNSTNFYVDRINRGSVYIRYANKISAGTNWETACASTTYTAVNLPYTTSFAAGADADITSGDYQSGWDLFADAEHIDLSLCITAHACDDLTTGSSDTTASTNIDYVIENVCEARKDCVAFCSPRFTDVVSNYGDEVTDTVTFREQMTASSYGFMDNNWKQIYDKYNDCYRWIPCNGDTAGLCVRTDQVRDPWWSPAGLNRGVIKNAVKLAYNPSQIERDELYLSSVNSIVAFAGQGIVLWGDKTMLNKPSAFSRINVRRLFIVLEKAIATYAKFLLFEFNDPFTRALFVATVTPYLNQIKGRRGLYDFRVIADETNNTAQVIDNNEFVGDIYLKPARSINYVTLHFIAVPTGVAFEEVVNNY